LQNWKLKYNILNNILVTEILWN